jgi:hypothetical protein
LLLYDHRSRVITQYMVCLLGLVILIGLLVFPVSRAVRRDLDRTGYALSTVVAVVASILLFVIAGFIFLSKFRFER